MPRIVEVRFDSISYVQAKVNGKTVSSCYLAKPRSEDVEGYGNVQRIYLLQEVNGLNPVCIGFNSEEAAIVSFKRSLINKFYCDVEIESGSPLIKEFKIYFEVRRSWWYHQQQKLRTWKMLEDVKTWVR